MKGFQVPSLPYNRAYLDQVPINDKKISDLKKLTTYIPDQYKEFYYEILLWKTTSRDGDDDYNDEG